MENLSGIVEKRRVPLSIPIDAPLRDHTFRGQAVLPAVYSMEYLARAIAGDVDPHTMVEASFKRFLAIAPETRNIEAFGELEYCADGSLTASLMSMAKVGAAGIVRALEHVRLTFPAPGNSPSPVPDLPLFLEGIPAAFSAERLYGELVPFGPSFHNITGNLLISENGARGRTTGGHPVSGTAVLGTPYPLDAAFHAACAWGQRHAGFTGFPVGLGRRTVVEPLHTKSSYDFLVTPTRRLKDSILYTIVIFDDDGRIREYATGVELRDITAGTLPPPPWIAATGEDPLVAIRERCSDLCIIALDAVPGGAAAALSPRECERFQGMQKRRGTSYLAARLALKTLARRRLGADAAHPLAALETDTDERKPVCPATGSAGSTRCTVSHDRDYAIAAIGDYPLGIDIEVLSDRVLASRSFYMHASEQALADSSPLGKVAASLRIWSIKEAVAKALDVSLPRSFELALVTAIGMMESALTVRGLALTARHATLGDHLVTLVVFDDAEESLL